MGGVGEQVGVPGVLGLAFRRHTEELGLFLMDSAVDTIMLLAIFGAFLLFAGVIGISRTWGFVIRKRLRPTRLPTFGETAPLVIAILGFSIGNRAADNGWPPILSAHKSSLSEATNFAAKDIHQGHNRWQPGP